MKEEFIGELARIAGQENVTRDDKDLSVYFRGPVPSVPLVAVSPGEPEQVIELVKSAAKDSVPIFTLKDARFSSPLPESGGIILDFKRMNTIEKVDVQNLTAYIQRGVTWEQLGEALKPHGLKTLMPANVTSPYVLNNMMCRVVMRSATRYPEGQISNLKVVLPDGQVHLSGSHTLAEDGADSKDDGGPNISRWYIGAEDILGIPVRGTVFTYPVPPAEEYMIFGFDDLAPALTAIRNIPRKEVCDQALVMNSNYLNILTKDHPKPLSQWILLLESEGQPRHVEFHAGVCRKDAAALGGKELPELKDALAPMLHRPWNRPEHSHGFYTFLNRVEEFHDLVSSRSNGQMGELFISHGYGRAAWCEFDHLDTSPKEIEKSCDEIDDLLLEKGAYFDRPLGRLGEKFYAGNPPYLNLIKRVKSMIDPDRILNPDQLLRGV